MWTSRRILATAFAAALGALLLASAAVALAAPGKHHHPVPGAHHPTPSDHPRPGHGLALIDESIAPSQPTDPTFHGVKPGGAPWVLKAGRVRLTSDGRLDLEVRGLVIPTTGTASPVTTITASLYCGADADATPAGTTQSVPISSTGNARIRDRTLTVPSTCLAPVILVHPNGIATAYIALDGWRMS
ncbi:MAG: hypothetical protein JOZ95_25725 [Solirubrobacterales bacterium]|nr:hypothetical protein [Solirubrobacterales bacterium]